MANKEDEFQDILPILENEIELLKKYEYLCPTIDEYDRRVKSYIDAGYSLAEAHRLLLNDIEMIMKESQPAIEQIIRNNNKNMEQTRKVVAGINFQRIIAYSLMNNVLCDNITEVVILVGKQRSEFKNTVEQYLTISVGDEKQKPDSDILIYSPNKKETPIMIASCKTSFRERAGQTYRWKLLYELSKCKCDHINNIISCPLNKYSIEMKGNKNVIVGLISTDFYDEVNNPQNCGMLPFFDFVFLGKQFDDTKYAKSLDGIIEYINKTFT